MANLGRVFQGVEYPSRREACQARHREYVRALADGLNFTQAAHAVGVSKRTGKVWRNGRTRSSGRCERASIAPQAHWYRLYMKCQPHQVSKRFLSLKERMLIFGWRVEGLSIRDIAPPVGAFALDCEPGTQTQWDYIHVLQPLHRSHASRQAPQTPQGAQMRQSSLVGHHLGQASAQMEPRTDVRLLAHAFPA